MKRGRREDFMGWVGVEGIGVDIGLKQLKVISLNCSAIHKTDHSLIESIR